METFLSFVYLIYFIVGLPLGVMVCTCFKTGEWKKTFSKKNLIREAKLYLFVICLILGIMAVSSSLKNWLNTKN